MDLNSLYHGALKVAELTEFPKEKVCLIHAPTSLLQVVGVEFADTGLFIVLNPEDGGTIEVIVEGGSATWLQPLDRMCGKYVNPKLALTAAAMIIAGCDFQEALEEVLISKVHIGSIPNRHTIVTVQNINELKEVEE